MQKAGANNDSDPTSTSQTTSTSTVSTAVGNGARLRCARLFRSGWIHRSSHRRFAFFFRSRKVAYTCGVFHLRCFSSRLFSRDEKKPNRSSKTHTLHREFLFCGGTLFSPATHPNRTFWPARIRATRSTRSRKYFPTRFGLVLLTLGLHFTPTPIKNHERPLRYPGTRRRLRFVARRRRTSDVDGTASPIGPHA